MTPDNFPENNSHEPEGATAYTPEDSPFDDLSQQGEFLTDPTDFRDLASIEERNRKIKIIIAILLGLFLLLGIGYFIWNTLTPQEQKATSTQTTAAPAPTKTKITSTDDNKPLLQQYAGGAPKALPGEVLVKLNQNTARATDNSQLVISTGAAFSPAVQPCRVADPTDFCLAGRGSMKDGAKTIPFDIYFLKDAAHSRLFENPINYKKQQVNGSPSAGSMDLDLGSNKAPTLVAINKNSSGWMLVLPAQTDPAKVAAALQVK